MNDRRGAQGRENRSYWNNGGASASWNGSSAGRGTPSLVDIVRALKLNEVPEFARRIEAVLIKGDMRAEQKYARVLMPFYVRQQLDPDWFRSVENNLYGELLFGHKLDGTPFGLDQIEMTRHTLVSGQSGTGKSTLLKSILYQSNEKQIPVCHFDRKGDLEHAARDGIDSIRWDQFRLNPLCPFDRQVDIREYRNEFAGLWGNLFQFFTRGLSIFLMGLDQLYRDFRVYEHWPSWDWEKNTFPTMVDLLAVFRSAEFRRRVRGQGVESLLSVCDKLESLIVEVEPTLACQRGFDLIRLYRERRAVNLNLDGVSVEYQNFIIVTLMLQYAHYFKVHGPRNQLNVLLMFDEAKGLLGKARQNFMIQDLVSKVRELGIGLVCADQIPSEISQFLFSNVGTLVMFRHSDGVDLQRLMYSMGCTPDQIRENYRLQPGEAIVRSMKSKDLHRIKVPFEPAEKFISRAELDELMAGRLKELNEDVIPVVREAKDQRSSNLDADERAFLECLARNFERPASEVYEEVGLSEGVGHRMKSRLLGKRWISQVETNLGKGGKRAVFLVPNPVVFEQLGIPLGPGRGKALHKHFQNSVKEKAEKFGFTARIEDAQGTSEGPDVGLQREGLSVAVEVCVTSRPSTESENIEKNFRLGFGIVVLSFVSKATLEDTRSLAARQYPAETLDKVKFCLVNQIAAVLEQLK